MTTCSKFSSVTSVTFVDTPAPSFHRSFQATLRPPQQQGVHRHQQARAAHREGRNLGPERETGPRERAAGDRQGERVCSRPAQPRFCRIFFTVARDRLMVVATSAGSARMSTTSADSIATSVPVPIAIPTSGPGERRRVVHAVTGPCRRCGPRPAALRPAAPCPRVAPRLTRADAELGRHALGRRPIVAGEHDDLDTLGAEPLDRRLRGSRARCPASAMTPAARPSTATCATVRPAPWSSAPIGPHPVELGPFLLEQAPAPDDDAPALDLCHGAGSGDRSEPGCLRHLESRASVAPTMASASGCSLSRSTAAARRSKLGLAEAVRSDLVDRGLSIVKVRSCRTRRW